MKTRALSIGGLLATIACLASSQAPDAVPTASASSANPSTQAKASAPLAPNQQAPKMIQVQMEYLEMSHETLTKLLFMVKPGTTDATVLRQQVQELVEHNEANVLETLLHIAKSAQNTSTESIRELTYPSGEDLNGKPVSEFMGVQNNRTTSAQCSSPATPSQFYVKNLGSTFEIEPTLFESSNIIDLRLIPELTWHTGNTPWLELSGQQGQQEALKKPDFYTLRCNTSLFCKNGQYTLAAVLTPKDAKGEADFTRKVMVFVKCDILTVK